MVLMAKYKIEHDRPNCIGCSACAAVSPEFWTMDECNDGKSDIKKEKGTKNLENGWEELDIDDKDYAQNKEAADACPVNVIHIKNLESNEKII